MERLDARLDGLMEVVKLQDLIKREGGLGRRRLLGRHPLPWCAAHAPAARCFCKCLACGECESLSRDCSGVRLVSCWRWGQRAYIARCGASVTDMSDSGLSRIASGEQQRMGMARLFFQAPKFGILDECTNATSVDVEEALYEHATSLGITLVRIFSSIFHS